MKDWLYFILDDKGRSYYVQNGLLVKTSAQPKPLTYTPDGWQDVAIGWERNMQKVGTVRNFTVPLGFVMDGAKILRHLLINENIEKKVYLLIKKLTYEALPDNKYQYIYRYFYRGELDLKTIEDNTDKVTVSIAEGGLSKLLKANEGTVNEYDLLESVRVRHDGIYLHNRVTYSVIDMDLDDTAITLPVSLIAQDGTTNGTAVFSQDYEVTPNNDYFRDSSNFLFIASEPITVTVTGTITVMFKDGINPAITEARALVALKTYTQTIYLLLSDHIPRNTPTTVTVNATITLAAQEKLFLTYGTPDLVSVLKTDLSSVYFSFKARKAPTFVNAYLPTTLFELLTESVTGSRDNAQSDLLDANKNLAVTSGDAIRGIDGAKLKTSLTQFTETFRVILAAGHGIEGGKLRIEAFDHFLKQTDPIDLGEAKDLKTSRAGDLFANTLKIGYGEKQIDDVNGKYEFNNTHLYGSPITSLAKELPLISPYNAQPYAQEIIRINLSEKKTTDNSNDNEVFLLNIDFDDPQTDADGTYYNLKRGSIAITGVPDPETIYNVLDLTPKRLAYKHRTWLNSIFYGFQGQKLAFKTTEKNADLVTVDVAETIIEKSDITIGRTKLFLPYYFDFDIQVPVDLVDLLEADPNRPFSFTWDGDTYTGFLIKAAIAPNTNKEQSYKLLAAPSNNLQNLL